MMYAALLSSHSEDSPGITGGPTLEAAVDAGGFVVRAQPGIRYEIVQRQSTEPWRGRDGATVRELIERMVNR